MIHRIHVTMALAVMLFFASVQDGHSQWTVLHPSFLNPDVAGACIFLSKDTGFIWGNAGLSYTQDGGSTWAVNSAIPDTGDRISFSNYNDCWLWTTEGTPAYFFRTTNHGTSWEKDSNILPLGLPPYLGAGAFFKDSLNGWYGTSELAIFHSMDGGRTWVKQYLDDRFTSSAIWNIAFCNDSLGIALAGPHEMYVLHTTDRGMNWHNLSADVVPSFLASSPTGLAYTDPRHAWLSTASGDLFRSTDSGLTWTGIVVPGSGYGIQAISFADSNDGIVVKRDQIVGGSTYDVVAYTSDGGQTWDTTLFHEWIRYASFPDTTTAYVCSAFNLYRLSTAKLGVSSLSPASSAPRLEAEDGNFVISMPQSSGGQLRIMDELGRVLAVRTLPPGARLELSASSPPRFRFAEVECNGRVQVFKILQ